MEQIPFGGKRNKILGGGIASDAAMLRRTMRAKEMANDWKTICFLFINSVAVGIRLNKQKNETKSVCDVWLHASRVAFTK